MNQNVLVIFLKYPEPGKVKTRLAKDIGEEESADLDRSFCETVILNTKSPEYSQIIFFAPQEKYDQIRAWIGLEADLEAQKGTVLGERLKNAQQTIFDKGFKKTVIIGTDSPLVNSKIIKKAFKELGNNECVIGPAKDGGYYLIGMSKNNKKIFDNIDWSTNKVFDQTENIIKKASISYKILEEQIDVDNLDDLTFLLKELEKHEDNGYKNLYFKIKEILSSKNF